MTIKNIVVLCDGTGKKIDENATATNVLLLFRMLRKDNTQRVLYMPGVGTIREPNAWEILRTKVNSVGGLVAGAGLDAAVLEAYTFIVRHYRKGDKLYLFGFSRGAYTVRVLAGLIRVIGILPSDQENLAAYGYLAYKEAGMKLGQEEERSNDEERPTKKVNEGDKRSNNFNEDDHTRSIEELGTDQLKRAFRFGDQAGSHRVCIAFLGCWDTVSSVFIPRYDRPTEPLSRLRLPFTQSNPSVQHFRHALAIDEHRRMFKDERWAAPKKCTPYPHPHVKYPHTTKQVWFSGSHGDVGGGWPERDLAQIPLLWMTEEAEAQGLKVKQKSKEYFAEGKKQFGKDSPFPKPDVTKSIHDSMNLAWRILGGATTRVIEDSHVLHKSVDERMKATSDYKPANVLDYKSRTGKKKRTRDREDEGGNSPLKKVRTKKASTSSIVSP